MVIAEILMISDATVGQRVLALRKELGKTQIEMAKVVGVATATWQKIERDEGLPAGETLMQFEKLGINPGWVLTGLGPKHLDSDIDGEAGQAEATKSGAVPEAEPSPSANGEKIIVERLDALQEQLGILIANANERAPQRYQRPPPPPSTMTFLPFRASAGGGSVVLEDSPGLDYGVDDLALQILEMRPKDIRLIEISGESMQPTFQSGDIVVADASYPRRENLPEDNEIYLIGKNGELLVKRAKWSEDGSLNWVSDNPAFAPIPDDDEGPDQVRTHGRVLWLWRRTN
ncbi:MAG: helix-turn-helix domain-containing protein [Agrobacterium cavarae]